MEPWKLSISENHTRAILLIADGTDALHPDQEEAISQIREALTEELRGLFTNIGCRKTPQEQGKSVIFPLSLHGRFTEDFIADIEDRWGLPEDSAGTIMNEVFNELVATLPPEGAYLIPAQKLEIRNDELILVSSS